MLQPALGLAVVELPPPEPPALPGCPAAALPAELLPVPALGAPLAPLPLPLPPLVAGAPATAVVPPLGVAGAPALPGLPPLGAPAAALLRPPLPALPAEVESEEQPATSAARPSATKSPSRDARMGRSES